MSDRIKDAKHIIDGGACNPVAVAGTIHRHSQAMLQEGTGMTAIRKDPALRLMVYQLAHLYDVLHFSFDEFNKLMEQVEGGQT